MKISALVLSLLSLVGGLYADAPSAPRLPAITDVQTATSHPMKYRISLPKHWSSQRRWPVLIAPSAHYGDGGKSLALFEASRNERSADFIIVAPFVINADPASKMKEYAGPI